jgi:diguanylate cyclase (GGDEF)-like protein
MRSYGESVIQPADGGNKGEMIPTPASLRLRFLSPIVGSMIFMLLAIALGISYLTAESRNNSLVNERLAKTKLLTMRTLETGIEIDASAIQSMLHSIDRDTHLAALFASRDRQALLEYTLPLYRELNENFNITHFYFMLPTRVNFLRVHAPHRHGDLINRTSLLQAEATGKIAHGVEMGVLGTLTLRVVYPWRDRKSGELLGYLELGKEIDHIIDHIRNSTGLDAFLLLHKNQLDRDSWSKGMEALGRPDTWDRYDEMIMQGEHDSTNYDAYFKSYHHGHEGTPRPLDIDGRSLRPVCIIVRDMRNEHIADLVVIDDVTFQTKSARNTLYAAAAAVFLFGLPLLIFFGLQAKKLTDRLADDERALRHRANTDPLTALATRRVFNESLSDEIHRSIRYQHPMALLMIDIDHFKHINDTYGHLAGDGVLRKIGRLLLDSVRSVDICCRYGGEEFTVILPETKITMASQLAERINRRIADEPFDLGADIQETITVSIGVAGYPVSGTTDSDLIAAADKALYKAKQTGRNKVCIADDS